jgi:hypothetical protein
MQTVLHGFCHHLVCVRGLEMSKTKEEGTATAMRGIFWISALQDTCDEEVRFLQKSYTIAVL